jgi:hypothetical protein
VDGLDPDVFGTATEMIGVSFDAASFVQQKFLALAAHRSAFGVTEEMLNSLQTGTREMLDAFRPVFEREVFVLAGTRIPTRRWPLTDFFDGVESAGLDHAIRIDAKRQALDALDAARRSTAHNGDGSGDGADQTEIPAVVEVSDDLTSQSRHSLLLSGSPPSGKLLIPLERRDVRVVEGARLESETARPLRSDTETPRCAIGSVTYLRKMLLDVTL